MKLRAQSYGGKSLLELNTAFSARELNCVLLDGIPVGDRIREATFKLLTYLMAHSDQSVAFGTLSEQVWEGNGTDQTIIRTINELVQVIGNRWIESPLKFSVRFSGIVDRLDNKSVCPIYTKLELDPAIGTIDHRINSRVKEAWISGLDNTVVVNAGSKPLLEFLKRGGKLRLLSTETKPEVSEMLDLIDPCEEHNSFKIRVERVTDAVQKWDKDYPENFEYRLLKFLPALGFFITDPGTASEKVKIEVYTARPWGEGAFDTRPHFVITEDTPNWREYFIRQFENYWDKATPQFSKKNSK